jgi:hypothetical protein
MEQCAGASLTAASLPVWTNLSSGQDLARANLFAAPSTDAASPPVRNSRARGATSGYLGSRMLASPPRERSGRRFKVRWSALSRHAAAVRPPLGAY